MSRFNRFEEFLTVALMSAALSLPVSAEEITVTVPPDPPAQHAIAPAPATPPATSAAGNMKTSQAPDDTTDQDAQTPPASPVEHKAEEKHPEMKAKSEPAAANKVDKPASTTKKASKAKATVKTESKAKHAAKKKHSTKKATAPEEEVLPWEKKAKSDSKQTPSSSATHTKTAKTKKPKTTVKKAAKPKAKSAPTVPVTSGSADELPWQAPTSSSASD